MLSMGNLKTILLIGLLNAFLIVACGGEAPMSPDKGASANTPSAAALGVLARADAADGKVDKIVSKCATCMLGMDGKAENSTIYGEYTLHFCSESCKESFAENPEETLLAIKLPEEKK